MMSLRLVNGPAIRLFYSYFHVDKIMNSWQCSALFVNKNCKFFHQQRSKTDNSEFFRLAVKTNHNSSGRISSNGFTCLHLLHSKHFSISTNNNLSYSSTTPPFASDFVQNCKHYLESKRFYAKGMDKAKKSKKSSNVVISEEEIGQLVDVQTLKTQLDNLFNEMKEEFAQNLSIRGASGQLETLQVEFDGGIYPLQELAQVGRKNPQMAMLNLSSLPEACQAVMKAILDSGMNVNPQQEGTTIYVPLPKVTREHRENLAKNAKAVFTKYKVLMQSVQNKFVKECKKQIGVSADLIFSVEQQILKLTELYIADAEKLMVTKQKELLDTK